MPLAANKKQPSYENMTEKSLVSDLDVITSSIPSKMTVPLESDRERVEKVRPDFYALEKASREENPPYPRRKPTPPEQEKIPYPKRKPTPPPQKQAQQKGRYGDFFDYKKGGRTGLAANSQAQQPHAGGLLHSDGAGRTDILNRNVTAGSYVIPADVVSALGDGNTMAGAKVLDQMMGPAPQKPSQFMNVPQPNYTMTEKKSVPVVMAGGEYVVSKEAIIAKFGNLDAGHDALDEFVRAVRTKNVKKLKSLPGPRT